MKVWNSEKLVVLLQPFYKTLSININKKAKEQYDYRTCERRRKH